MPVRFPWSVVRAGERREPLDNKHVNEFQDRECYIDRIQAFRPLAGRIWVYRPLDVLLNAFQCLNALQ